MSFGSWLTMPATASRTSIAAVSRFVLLENSIVTRAEPKDDVEEMPVTPVPGIRRSQ